MLMIVCPTCDGEGTRFIPRRGGNDPDGRTVSCECDDGEVSVLCNVCDAPATAQYEKVMLCATCLTERMEDV